MEDFLRVPTFDVVEDGKSGPISSSQALHAKGLAQKYRSFAEEKGLKSCV